MFHLLSYFLIHVACGNMRQWWTGYEAVCLRLDSLSPDLVRDYSITIGHQVHITHTSVLAPDWPNTRGCIITAVE